MSTTTFDLNHRPRSYWDHPCLAWSQTAGTIRRLALRLEHEQGIPSELPPKMSGTHLEVGLRDAMGARNPRCRSGEDLPDYMDEEVEIARLWYRETVHCEVTAIRARRRGESIRYRVVGEYGDDIRYRIQPTRSELPLTLGELVRLIDTAKVGPELVGIYFGDLGRRIESGDYKPIDLHTFILVESPFYPELTSWYQEAQRRWSKLIECGWGFLNQSLRLMADRCVGKQECQEVSL